MRIDRVQRNLGACLLAGGVAAGCAITMEAWTDPDDSDRAGHYVSALAAPVALLLFVAVVAVAAGLVGVAMRIQTTRGRGLLGPVLIVSGLIVAEIPHTVLDLTAIPVLFDRLPRSQAQDLVDNHVDSWPGLLSGLGVLLLLIGSVVLARVLWTGDILPRWAPRLAILGFVLGIAMLPAAALGWWFPHGPVLIYLGLAVYGVALMTEGASTPTVKPTSSVTAA